MKVQYESRCILGQKQERTVYWGTSGQRITEQHSFDSFAMVELLESGILLHGDEVRGQMIQPAYGQMRVDVARHMVSTRQHGNSVGWLLDIARGMYTLRTKRIIAKTKAGEWALNVGICPDPTAMQLAVDVRNAPHHYTKEDKAVDNATIQLFADILEKEFENTLQLFAESELEQMGIAYQKVVLIRYKDGVSIWRVFTNENSCVLKCFDKPEYRREIENYKILSSLAIPTLTKIAHTECSLLLEDIELSTFRLGAISDMSNPIIVARIAAWYQTLHKNGVEYANAHALYDECDTLTLENIRFIQKCTGTSALPVWRHIEENFSQIQSVAFELPRTLTYNDFHHSNLVVANDGSSAMMFDYNLLGKGYAYSDIRNVCEQLENDDMRTTFLATYGTPDEKEAIVDAVVGLLFGLYSACKRKTMPTWADVLLDMVNNGTLEKALMVLLLDE